MTYGEYDEREKIFQPKRRRRFKVLLEQHTTTGYREIKSPFPYHAF